MHRRRGGARCSLGTHLGAGACARNAEAQLTSPMTSVDASEMLKRFEAVQVSSTPYGYALDSTGEDSLEYIEGDPVAGSPSVVLEDRDWISLQGICEP